MRTRLSIKRGERFSRSLRIETMPYVYVPITAVTQSAPVRITAPGHGLLDGQRAAIVSVRGMSELNARSMPPKIEEYRQATVIDADTIEFNTVNTADSPVYKGGGYVQRLSLLPVDGIKARMAVKDKIGGTEHLRLTTETGEITCDTANRRITFTLTDEQTAAMHAKCRVADLELIGSDGQVFKTVEFEFQIIGEVAT